MKTLKTQDYINWINSNVIDPKVKSNMLKNVNDPRIRFILNAKMA